MSMLGDIAKDVFRESGGGNLVRDIKAGASTGSALDNRSIGGRLESAGRRAWNHQDMTQAGRIGMMAGGAAAVGGIGYGVAQGAQDHPLGTGAAVLGAAVALSLRPSSLGAFAKDAAKSLAEGAQVGEAKGVADGASVARDVVAGSEAPAGMRHTRHIHSEGPMPVDPRTTPIPLGPNPADSGHAGLAEDSYPPSVAGSNPTALGTSSAENPSNTGHADEFGRVEREYGYNQNGARDVRERKKKAASEASARTSREKNIDLRKRAKAARNSE